jgi:hypothetical protein
MAFVVGAIVVGCSTAAPLPTPVSTPAPTAGQATPGATPPPPTATPVAPSLPPNVIQGGNNWGASAGNYLTELGEQGLFTCPPDGTEYAVWGTDIYTSDSSVCTAGVHSGLITYETGGTLIAERREGQQAYVGSTRNGVTTRDYTTYGSSFILVGAPVSVPTPPGATPATSGSAYEQLLELIPPIVATTCTEIDPAAAGAKAVANCDPEDRIIDPVVTIDDVVYIWFENIADAEDEWLEKYELLGEPSSGDCSTGSCITGLTPEGALYGRFTCGPDTVYGMEVVGWWYDNRTNVVGSNLLAEGTCTDVMNLMQVVALGT